MLPARSIFFPSQLEVKINQCLFDRSKHLGACGRDESLNEDLACSCTQFSEVAGVGTNFTKTFID